MQKILVAIFAMIFPLALNANPKPWQFGFQDSGSPVMDYIYDFHNIMLIVIFGIITFVTVLLVYILLRFNKRRNPNPSKTSHNVKLEIIWTVIPILIVLAISVPSMKVLKFEEEIPESEFTLKIVGHQWYWSYEYPDHDGISFDSNIKYDLEPGEPRLLAVDNEIVLPIQTNVRIQITGADVIHSWGIPSLGVKKDAIPGRLNETWLNIKKEGKYYGQCYELCGILHGFMPIAIKAVSREDFNHWIEENKNNI
jgi:cytochrome c oxidase subunit 2